MNRRRLLQYGAFGLVAPGLGALAGGRRAPAEARIVRCAIHPAIGIARVGNSPDGWFLAPEVPGQVPDPPGGFKDEAGRVKRQVARFRVYGLDEEDRVVREITTEEAEIEWTVHLANAKGAWYAFDEAFDIPSSQGEPPAPLQPAPAPLRSARRNAAVVERDRLVIDPGPRTVRGAYANAEGNRRAARFDGGTFLGTKVPLGEVRTDGAGRLLVFGGRGHSASVVPGLLAKDFANNDLWYDDTADGPVDATVRLDGREVPVTGAWVVVAPPNFAPGLHGVVTMYDVVFAVATRFAPDLKPERPSFTRQIYPLFARMVGNQWVNAGMLRDFGWGAAGDFLAPATLAQLADPSAAARFLRRQVFERFRDPAYVGMDADGLPPYYGDGMGLPPTNPRQWMAVLDNQYDWLRQWADGDFDADWPAGGPMVPGAVEELPVDEQPDALDRAALDDCLGGPFHPGCELTWPMRRAELYAAPFRIARRRDPEPDWGDFMTSLVALAGDGPLAGSGPGGLTRWMAVPWQTDTSSCLSRYIADEADYLPTFWPARVPNDVLTPESYRQTLDADLDPDERRRAFATRRKWLRGLPSLRTSPVPRINAFIAIWDKAGIVTRQPGPTDEAPFPDAFWVELGHAIDPDDPAIPRTLVEGSPGVFGQTGAPTDTDPNDLPGGPR